MTGPGYAIALWILLWINSTLWILVWINSTGQIARLEPRGQVARLALAAWVAEPILTSPGLNLRKIYCRNYAKRYLAKPMQKIYCQTYAKRHIGATQCGSALRHTV